MSQIFTTYFQTSLLQDPTTTCVQIFCFQNLVLILETTVLEHFGEDIVKNL